MKRFVKVISLLLAFCLLFTACGGKASAPTKKPVYSADMNEEEAGVVQFLKRAYTAPTVESLNEILYDTTDAVNLAALYLLSQVIPTADVKEIIAKDLGNFDLHKIYAVAAVVTQGGADMLINDVVIVAGDSEEGFKIVLQQLYAEDSQDDVIDSLDAISSAAKGTFAACNEKLGKTNPYKTPYSIGDTAVVFKDAEGNVITGKSGVIIAIDGKDVYAPDQFEPADDNDDSGSSIESDVPQSRGDGRKLSWNCEFTQGDGELHGNFSTEREAMFVSGNDTVSTSADRENIFTSNGVLNLRIRPIGGGHYVMPRTLSTYNRMSFRYGYLEIRAKVPFRKSVWPSFWMQSEKDLCKTYMSEIDIFEVFGSSTSLASAIHKWGDQHVSTSAGRFSFSDAATANSWHTYALDWTPEYLKFLVDGKVYGTVPISQAAEYSSKFPGMQGYHDYHFVIFNNWTFYKGGYDGDNVSQRLEDNPLSGPVDYQIDYVRLYQYENSNELLKLY